MIKASTLLDNVRSSLDEINHELRNVEERREKLIKGTRDVIALCSKSIIALHRSEIDQAQINIHQAKTMLEEFRQSYITGLLDCIGEVKRMVYDKMRVGKAQDAASLFLLMQDIYGAVYPFAVYDHLVSGMRRKLDVAKMLIEDVRAVVTEETRREVIIKAIDNLEKKLQNPTT